MGMTLPRPEDLEKPRNRHERRYLESLKSPWVCPKCRRMSSGIRCGVCELDKM